MKKLFEDMSREVDTAWLLKNTERLMDIERGQTFSDYHKAAQFAAELVRSAGIAHCEIINFPADGKTVCLDHVMPLAWNATRGKLTVVNSAIPFDEPVIADFQRHPFHLIKGSVATPEAGLTVRIITESQLFGGEDAEGCLVVTDSATRPRGKILSAALDLGAIGIITDFFTGNGRYATPDAVSWVTACTEGGNWHVNAADRPFIGFSVSPRTGDRLRTAASAGDIIARVECDGVRSEGQLPLVTALIPGRQREKELWILSHLYEPLADDNSSGVVASIEMARIIRRLAENGRIPPLEFSLRLVFGMECYGFAAYAESLGGNLRDKVIGAINTDALPITAEANLKIHLAPPGTPFFGNFLMIRLANEYQGEINPAINNVVGKGMYADDTFLSDATTGVPTLWPIGAGKLWHNSEQRMNIISPLAFSRITALLATWTGSVVTLGQEKLPETVALAEIAAEKQLLDEKCRILASFSEQTSRQGAATATAVRDRMMYRLQIVRKNLEDFRKVADLPLIDNAVEQLNRKGRQILGDLSRQAGELPPPSSGERKAEKWFDYAASIIPSRATRGFPHCLAAVPREERRELPEGVMYGPFARILANMDGEKSLQRLLLEAEWETGKNVPTAQLKKYITAISYLSDYGYLKTTFKCALTEKDIVVALHELGISRGDLLLVHSSLSRLGRIEGGAGTVIDTVLQAVGANGTALFPAFTRSFIYMDGMLVKSSRIRPYDRDDPSQIWVGSIPRFFLGRKGVFRSAHPTHSVAGLGPLAEACLSPHRENEPPTCRSSPMGKLLEHQGKILYFGSGLAPTTFLHFLEDEMHLSYLASAVCRIKDPDGTIRTVLIPKHLPGHRDFYTPDAENCKFFKKAVAAGLEIKSAPLGVGKLQLIDASQLYELGIAALEEDPGLLLCDNSECRFCSKHQSDNQTK